MKLKVNDMLLLRNRCKPFWMPLLEVPRSGFRHGTFLSLRSSPISYQLLFLLVSIKYTTCASLFFGFLRESCP